MQFQWWRCSTRTAFAQVWLETTCQFLPTTFSSTKMQRRWWHICLKIANNQAEIDSQWESCQFFQITFLCVRYSLGAGDDVAGQLVSTRLPSCRCQMCTRNPFYILLPRISFLWITKVFRKFVLHSVMTLLVSSRLPSGRCKSATGTDRAPDLFSGKLRRHGRSGKLFMPTNQWPECWRGPLLVN